MNNKEELEERKRGELKEQQGIAESLTVEYELTEDGYISDVILKDKSNLLYL